MSFWLSLGAYVNTTNMPLKCINMRGRLHDQLSPQNPQGPVMVSAVVCPTVVEIWDANQLATAMATQWGPPIQTDSVYAYWLPWRQFEVTTVSLATLDASGCNYFLTSEFSGCRFVITNDRIQHVAWGAGQYHDGTSLDRDKALVQSWQGTPAPTRARTYSYSRPPNPGALGNPARDGYGQQNWDGSMNPNVRASVIGFKMLNQWHFYMQRWIAGSTNASFVKIGI